MTGNSSKSTSLQPLAPPPAGAPPLPPLNKDGTTITPGSESQPLLYTEDGGGNGTGGYSAKMPTITHYYAGADINLNPNTGKANAFQEEFMGLALSEIVYKLQWSCVLSSFCVLLWEFLVAWKLPIQFVTVGPDWAILSIYLLLFALALFVLEVFFTASMLYSYQIIPELWIYKIYDNFGFLFHPLKKAIFVLWLATNLLFRSKIAWIVEYLLGLWWVANSLCTMYVWYRYPDFRSHTHQLRVAAREQIGGEGNRLSFTKSAWHSWSYFNTLVWKDNASSTPTTTNV